MVSLRVLVAIKIQKKIVKRLEGKRSCVSANALCDNVSETLVLI